MEKLLKLLTTLLSGKKDTAPTPIPAAPPPEPVLPPAPAPAPVVIPNIIKVPPEAEPKQTWDAIKWKDIDYGMDVIKMFEGCKLEAYKDIVGVWTIGYGQTGQHVKEGLVWTQEDADNALAEEYRRFKSLVAKNVQNKELLIGINVRQVQALTSFTYNCGERNLQSLIRNRTVEEVGNSLTLYNKAGGKPVRGLTIRRGVEKALYFSVINNKFDAQGVRNQLTQEV